MAKLPGMLTPADWEALYHQLGQIISDEPNIPTGGGRGSIEILQWLGRAEALIEQVSGIVDHSKFGTLRTTMLTATLTDAETQMRHIRGLLYTALAKAELSAPATAKGAFIPAGNSFDALTAIAGVLRECEGSVLIVDPYMDAIALTDFLPMVKEGVSLRLLASGKQKNAGLPEAVERWKMQYAQARPIELRLAAPKLLHDRLIMDDVSVWSLSQSFNAIALRSPAMVQRVGADIASAKREAFIDMWNRCDER
ncbi:hypothetical protein [Sphingomonas sp. IC081]|uniref:hypothetical protein n=1 Tax=Sphingomonas sp. IC081 TaxID=304378 RepID=UPI0011578908|nr:hypothetical protein [Sphingomonas sp. IC081]QDK32581.1 hypothetical protein DM450_07245 [Sphingomonas sp. IC081]